MMMIGGCAAAMAGQAEDLFCHQWICEAEDDFSVDIAEEDGTLYVLGMYLAEDGIRCIEFDQCTYDAEKGVLICEGGILTRESIEDEEEDSEETGADDMADVESDGEETDDSEDEDEDTGEVLISGFGAELRVDENGMLHWTGSGDVVADRSFVNGDEEDDGVFTGEWECGEDAELIIEKYGSNYFVSITISEGDTYVSEWEYLCEMDENGGLTGIGTMTVSVIDEENDRSYDTEAYTDGRAVFTRDGDAILWKDLREDAGKGLRFVRMEEDDEEIEAEVLLTEE